MPSLTKAFKQMRHMGLIAKLECYCEHCGQQKVSEAAQQRRAKQKAVAGFVYVGEVDPPVPMERLRIPLVFGSVDGKRIAYCDRGCLAVGEIVSECLQGEGIQYEWDRTPGSPILVKVDQWLWGIPPATHHHDGVQVSENNSVFRNPHLPDALFDKIEGNPIRLLNVATVRRLNMDLPECRGSSWRPRVRDHVKLGFLVWDAIAPRALTKYGDNVRRMQLECMWVEVTGAMGKYPECVYRGELLNIPVFIDPATLRIGSPVNFTPEHMYPGDLA